MLSLLWWYVCGGVHVIWHTSGGQRTTLCSCVSPSTFTSGLGSGNKTQVTRLLQQTLYLTDPSIHSSALSIQFFFSVLFLILYMEENVRYLSLWVFLHSQDAMFSSSIYFPENETVNLVHSVYFYHLAFW